MNVSENAIRQTPMGPIVTVFRIFSRPRGIPHFQTYQYGSVSKPCTPGEHQNSW